MNQAFFAPFSNSFDLVFENIHVVAKVGEVEGGKKFSSDVQTSVDICTILLMFCHAPMDLFNLCVKNHIKSTVSIKGLNTQTTSFL